MKWPIARPFASSKQSETRMQVNRYGAAAATKDLPLVVAGGGSR